MRPWAKTIKPHARFRGHGCLCFCLSTYGRPRNNFLNFQSVCAHDISIQSARRRKCAWSKIPMSSPSSTHSASSCPCLTAWPSSSCWVCNVRTRPPHTRRNSTSLTSNQPQVSGHGVSIFTTSPPLKSYDHHLSTHNTIYTMLHNHTTNTTTITTHRTSLH